MTGSPGRLERATLGARLFVALQYLLPQHGLSRLVHVLARRRWAPLKNLLIRVFVGAFRPDMSDALEPDPRRYATFNAFFTRALRPEARPIDADPAAVVAPVDGTLSEAGPIGAGRLLQAKGIHYPLEALLAGREAWSARFRDGVFATIYLAPYDYHRIHMPCGGTLIEAWYVPGRLFSVNRTTAAAVPGLFARNERLVCGFLDREARPFALVLVGALNVGSMSTVWHGEVTPRRARRIAPLPLTALRAPLRLEAGAEMGHFNLGSTVIVLFPGATVALSPELAPGRTLRVGQRIGRFG